MVNSVPEFIRIKYFCLPINSSYIACTIVGAHSVNVYSSVGLAMLSDCVNMCYSDYPELTSLTVLVFLLYL